MVNKVETMRKTQRNEEELAVPSLKNKRMNFIVNDIYFIVSKANRFSSCNFTY